MKRSILFLWICTLLIVPPIVHGDDEHPDEEKLLSLIRMNNDFAFHLYKRLVAMPDYQSKNIFFSPLSVSMALSAVSLGAGGETRQQLLRGIGHNNSVLSFEEMHQAFHSLLHTLNQTTGVDLNVGSALYVSNKFKPLPEFFEKLEHLYHSEGFSVDFSNKETLDKLNTYVEEKTHGKINKAVEQLNADTLMYLLTYIYFKGKWAISFNPSETREDKFHVDAKTTVPIKLMHQDELLKVYYDRELSTKVLCLDYNDSFSMILAVPEYGHRVTSISDLEKSVSRQHIEKWKRSVMKRNVDIYVPKLSLKTSYSLNDILKGMGMTEMFTDKANFTGISEKKMFISEVAHQATLDIDEEGTTAAAVTTVRFTPFSYNPLASLRFDHPFMIFITEQKNDNILFIGKVVNPAENQ